MTPKTRRYCWRTGHVWSQDDGSKCGECGSQWASHNKVPADECGAFASCGDHGHPCIGTPGHEGDHYAERCAP